MPAWLMLADGVECWDGSWRQRAKVELAIPGLCVGVGERHQYPHLDLQCDSPHQYFGTLPGDSIQSW